MAASKTYFVLTNFDLPPDGPIKLGSIIADPLEPEEILNPGDVVALPSDHVHTSHKRDWDIAESLQNGQVSVTARFLSSLRLDGMNGTGRDSEVTSRFSLKDVETLDFAPRRVPVRIASIYDYGSENWTRLGAKTRSRCHNECILGRYFGLCHWVSTGQDHCW
ncbi:hypothetical protein DL98DRAFT_517865 [Cadophora sp. DSE1049]|nr:hypothetical protein DL98DRAFT_517865 [Cadophora sp. DSE1049]